MYIPYKGYIYNNDIPSQVKYYSRNPLVGTGEEKKIRKESEDVMGGRMSKEKGKRGERELAKVFQAHGYSARRGQQFAGGAFNVDGSPSADVVVEDIPELLLEVKRIAKFAGYKFIDQAVSDSEIAGQKPLVAVRANNREWLFMMREDLFFELLGKYTGLNGD